MKKLGLVVAVLIALSSVSAFADVGYGTVLVGPNFACTVTNNTPIHRNVISINYQYSCGTPYSSVPYNVSVPCSYNCFLPAGATMTFNGPSTYNCNVMSAACSVYSNP